MYRFILPLLALMACAPEPEIIVQHSDDLPEDSALRSDYQNATYDLDTLVPENLVTLQVTYTQSYCNGAYPSDEVLEDLKKKRPLTNVKLLLKREYEVAVETNLDGQISAVLDPGKYAVFLDQENQNQTAPFNIHCQAYYEQEWATLIIDSLQYDYQVHIDFPCDLCDATSKKRP